MYCHVIRERNRWFCEQCVSQALCFYTSIVGQCNPLLNPVSAGAMYGIFSSNKVRYIDIALQLSNRTLERNLFFSINCFHKMCPTSCFQRKLRTIAQKKLHHAVITRL